MSVFTKVSHTELTEFLSRYAVGELLGFQGIGEGIENTNYFVDTADGRWVLTLFERLNYDDLPFFLGLMEHLASRGYACAMPQRARDGQTLQSLNGKPAALVRRLVGGSILFPTLGQCRASGHALGELHRLTASFEMRCANPRGTDWRAVTGRSLLPRLEGAAHALLSEELQTQRTLDLSRLPQGVIHADLFRDNVLFVDDRLGGVIDFYYACNDALIYDLAVTVNDWCFEVDGHLNPARYEAMTAAYVACRDPHEDERAAWPLVLRAAALRFWLSRLCDWLIPREGDLVHVKDPAPYRRILEWHRDHAPAPLP